MIKFKLYSSQYPNGFLLAQCADGSTEYVLTQHYRNTYKGDDFMVTRKAPRRDEEIITRDYDIFKEKYWDIFSKWIKK